MKAQKHIFLQMEKDSYFWALRLKIALLKAEKVYFLNVDPKCQLFFLKIKERNILFGSFIFFSFLFRISGSRIIKQAVKALHY